MRKNNNNFNDLREKALEDIKAELLDINDESVAAHLGRMLLASYIFELEPNEELKEMIEIYKELRLIEYCYDNKNLLKNPQKKIPKLFPLTGEHIVIDDVEAKNLEELNKELETIEHDMYQIIWDSLRKSIRWKIEADIETEKERKKGEKTKGK